MSQNTNFSATWVISSGHAITMPIAFFPNTTEDNTISINNLLYYHGRNGSRMPVYHRLDFSYKHSIIKKNKIHSISIDVYNAYNNLNAYYLMIFNYDRKENTDRLTVWKRTLFPIIPSISYSLKF